MLEKNKKKQSIIKKIDYILIAFQIIIAVALGVKLFTMGVVPIFDIIYNYNSDIKYWNFFFD